MKLNTLDWITLILIIIGGLNWGLVGLFNFNLVSAIFGVQTFWTELIYTLVFLSAIYELFIVGRFTKRPRHAR